VLLIVARNALYSLDMLPGETALHTGPVVYDQLESIASPADGFFTPIKNLSAGLVG
jgi:hypothetical protein